MAINFLSGIDVDNGVLYTDTANNRVGINTNSPTEVLDVRGNVHVEANTPSITLKRDISDAQDFSITNNGNLIIEKNGTDGGGNLIIKDENDLTPFTVNMSNTSPDIIIEGDLIAKDKTGTTQHFVVKENNGNVGIGTSSPQEKLDISAGSIRLDDNQRISWSTNDSNIGRVRITGNESNDFISFATDNSERMRLTNTGLGIGTTSPSQKLHVVGTGFISSTLYVGSTNNAIYNYITSLIIQAGNGNSISLGGGPGNINNNVGVGNGNLNVYNGTLDVNGTIRGKNYLYLEDATGTLRTTLRSEASYATLDNGSNSLNYNASNHLFLIGLSEKMRIAASGNVGIGTTAPGALLEVNGNSKFVGSMQFYQGSTSNLYLNILQSSSNTYINTGTSGETIYFGAPAVNTTNINVQGTVTATATTDAYKGYIKQTVVSIANEKSASADYNLIPFNTITTTTANQYYNRMVAAYDGRVKKIFIRNTGASTPTATHVNFKKQVNNVTSSIVYSGTVSNAASAGMSAYYNFADSDFTFSAGDTFGILYQTTDGFGTASRLMGGVAVTIILEYNIT